MCSSDLPLKVMQVVEPFPPIQSTDNPYLTEAAMYADQANQLQGYGYLVDGVGAFTYLGTVAGTAADYEGFGANLRLSNLAADLSTAEKDGIKTKLSIVASGASGNGIASFQEVTDIGNATTNEITVKGATIKGESHSPLTLAGIIKNENFIGDSLNNDFITTLSSGSGYNVNNGFNALTGHSDFSKYISLNKVIGTTKWEQEVTFKVNTLNSLSYGVGLGTISNNSSTEMNKSNFIAQLFLHSDVSLKGKIRFYHGETFTKVISTSTSSLVFSLNDVIKIKLKRVENLFILDAYNVTTGTSISHSYTYNLSTIITPLLPNTGKFKFYFFGIDASYSLSNYTYTNKGVKNGIAYIGDSITNGYRTPSFLSGFVPNVSDINNWLICGGQGDRSVDVLQSIDNMLLENTPTIAVLFLGQNDSGLSYGVGNFSTSMQSIITKVINAECTVYILTTCPRNDIDNTPYVNETISLANSNLIQYYDIFNLLKDGTSSNFNPIYSADVVHPNEYGHKTISDVIRENFSEINSISGFVNFTVNNLLKRKTQFSKIGIDANDKFIVIDDLAGDESNSTTTAFTSTTLNNIYPDALLFKRVYCNQLATPTVYTKISSTTWYSQNINVV